MLLLFEYEEIPLGAPVDSRRASLLYMIKKYGKPVYFGTGSSENRSFGFIMNIEGTTKKLFLELTGSLSDAFYIEEDEKKTFAARFVSMELKPVRIDKDGSPWVDDKGGFDFAVNMDGFEEIMRKCGIAGMEDKYWIDYSYLVPYEVMIYYETGAPLIARPDKLSDMANPIDIIPRFTKIKVIRAQDIDNRTWYNVEYDNHIGWIAAKDADGNDTSRAVSTDESIVKVPSGNLLEIKDAPGGKPYPNIAGLGNGGIVVFFSLLILKRRMEKHGLEFKVGVQLGARTRNKEEK